MKKVIRLTEKDLTRIVKRVIKEQDEEWNPAPAKGNDHLNEIFDEIQAIADYVRDTYEFSNRIRDFYNDYKEELDELTDEEYTKLDERLLAREQNGDARIDLRLPHHLRRL